MKEPKQGFVYILFNKRNGTLYTGVTSDLIKRMYQHKNKVAKKSFTGEHNVMKLGYFEESDSITDAIVREKQIKSWSRDKKVALITSMNPDWDDLYERLV